VKGKIKQGRLRGRSPLFIKNSPSPTRLSHGYTPKLLVGEGDKGGEVSHQPPKANDTPQELSLDGFWLARYIAKWFSLEQNYTVRDGRD
jgi:hypothetical protein